MRLSFLVGSIVVAALIILTILFWPGEQPDEISVEPAPAPVEAPVIDEITPDQEAIAPVEQADMEPVPQAPVKPEIILPELHESDELVRQTLSRWPVPDAVLQRGDLLARLAVVITNAADGLVPRRQIGFLVPGEKFQIVEVGEQIFLDPRSYTRYDGYLSLLESVPAGELADFLAMFDALLQQALGQLGERRTMRDLLAQAARRVNELPDLPERVELLQPKVMYQYADPDLEGLPDFEKQILRMGPANVARLQAYISRLQAAYPPPSGPPRGGS